ncbi:Serine/threonine-protein kinase BRI1-like 2 [Hibiscus syriacus]|uniref:non-specific serine/threonine protein kinase n=1 Tax=Hibiscus syriacus TaxID=106335 RepID=A0A6A2ZH67_HIBSY|nr:Serine/threonine-protein kinase BRI1-like 2 [Hibiscus syriacus]
MHVLDLSNNNITGPFPDSILRNFSALEALLLSNNIIFGPFSSSISYCKSLRVVYFSSNKFLGIIPPDICPGAAALEELKIPDNLVTGQIPSQLSQCPRLRTVDLSLNYLNGSIPAELGTLENLEQLIAWFNDLERQIPKELGKRSKLKDLNLNNNRLGGEIPVELSSCSNLEWISLTSNELNGSIPRKFGMLSRLAVLQLANNSLSGEIPGELGNCTNLVWLDINSNELTGEIPPRLGRQLGAKSFSGIHSSNTLVFVRNVGNSCTGVGGLLELSTIPTFQYANNPGLCGVPLPECRNGNNQAPTSSDLDGKRSRKPAAVSWANSIVLGVFISIASICILIVWAIAMRERRREAEEVKMLNRLQAVHAATTWKMKKEKEPLSINVATFQRQLRKLKFSTLIEATNCFSATSLIGSGGFGEVFKATLKDGSSVPIKKLIRLSCQGDREFMAEMEMLGKIKHKNLVPLLGYYMIGEERLLVYEFIEDMKSSNVLLDHEVEARVSDFGMARLISALDTHLSVNTLVGTPGYVPPEYYQSFLCMAKGDVYSLGVVLLELLTGKRPTDKEDFGDTNLVGWVKLKVREQKHMEAIDPEILLAAEETDEAEAEAEEVKEMMTYLEITLQCIDDFPSKRPNMLQVVALLRELMPGSANGSSNCSTPNFD